MLKILKKGDQTALVETTNLKDLTGERGGGWGLGLAKTITIAVGAKVMLTKNLDLKLCYCNYDRILSRTARTPRQ